MSRVFPRRNSRITIAGFTLLAFSLVAAVSDQPSSSASAGVANLDEFRPEGAGANLYGASDEALPAFAEEDRGSASRDDIEDRDVAQGEIDAFADHHDLSEDKAERRIRLELATTGLDDRLMERWPDSYASSWMEPGELEVVVTFAGEVDDLDRRAAKVAAEFAYPDHLEVRDGADSPLGELRDAYEQIATDGEHLHATGEHPRQAFRETRGKLGVGLDIKNNGVTLTIPESTRDEMRRQDDPQGVERVRNAVQAHYGVDNVAVDKVDEPTATCSRLNCQWYMMAGLQLLWSSEDCTSGFTTWKDGSYYVMSAAHCNGSWRKNGDDGHYGQVHTQQLGGPMDVELIRHSTNPWNTYGWFYLPSEIRAVDSYTRSYNMSWTIGMSGAASGNFVRRGNMVNTSWSGWFEGEWVYDFVRADYCDLNGDSGAPVFRNHTALGIHNGRLGWCDTLFTKIANPLDHWDLILLGG